jgi:hypothetical protein
LSIYTKRPGQTLERGAHTAPVRYASDKQVHWILTIAAELGTPRDEAAVKAMPAKEASTLLDILFEASKAQRAARRNNGVDDGFYRLGGQFVKVVWNQAGTRKYALLYDGAHWDYESANGVYGRLTPDMALSVEDAKGFGALYGKCVYCHRKLTDDRSIEVGYGKDCAGQRGLPWG